MIFLLPAVAAIVYDNNKQKKERLKRELAQQETTKSTLSQATIDSANAVLEKSDALPLSSEVLDSTVDLTEAFTCPISQQLINEPVSSKYGHLFEKAAIEQWVTKNHTCPMTNNPLELSDLYPQYAVKEAITQFKKLQLGLSSGSIKFKISGDVSSIDEEFKQNKSEKEEFDDLSVNLDALRLEHLQISGEAESVNEESLAISQPWVMP